MGTTRLRQLLKNIDLFISQHGIYISKLEKALKEKEPFDHKDCHSCNFGTIWDRDVAPYKEELTDDVRKVVEEIEEAHCKFHEVSMKIDPLNPRSSDEDNIRVMKQYSDRLFSKLLGLRKIILQQEV